VVGSGGAVRLPGTYIIPRLHHCNTQSRDRLPGTHILTNMNFINKL
jgi:hypothetical protein